MNNEKLVFCSLLDFGIEVKGLWTSVDKTYMMTRTIAKKSIVHQANFEVLGPKSNITKKTLFLFLSCNTLILINMCQCAFFLKYQNLPFNTIWSLF